MIAEWLEAIRGYRSSDFQRHRILTGISFFAIYVPACDALCARRSVSRRSIASHFLSILLTSAIRNEIRLRGTFCIVQIVSRVDPLRGGALLCSQVRYRRLRTCIRAPCCQAQMQRTETSAEHLLCLELLKLT